LDLKRGDPLLDHRLDVSHLLPGLVVNLYDRVLGLGSAVMAYNYSGSLVMVGYLVFDACATAVAHIRALAIIFILHNKTAF